MDSPETQREMSLFDKPVLTEEERVAIIKFCSMAQKRN